MITIAFDGSDRSRKIALAVFGVSIVCRHVLPRIFAAYRKQLTPYVQRFYDRVLDLNIIPDALIRWGVRAELRDRINNELIKWESQPSFFSVLDEFRGNRVVAERTDAANEQHYEVPPEFFHLCLGAQHKYSCCYYPTGNETLDEAEVAMLELYVERAQIADGMTILDLGCGWGSLTVFLHNKFPNCRILAMSNSAPQREYILANRLPPGVKNVTIVTEDINSFEIDRSGPFSEGFDRILSIEMFEHIKNYESVFDRLCGWVKSDGYVFLHVFCNARFAYHFVDDESWMARNFFSGGTMPSASLFSYFQRDLILVNQWNVPGRHYAQTCEHWLQKMDQNISQIKSIFGKVYGSNQIRRWVCGWRIFYIACAECFWFGGGREWYVSHYLFRPRRGAMGAAAGNK